MPSLRTGETRITTHAKAQWRRDGVDFDNSAIVVTIGPDCPTSEWKRNPAKHTYELTMDQAQRAYNAAREARKILTDIPAEALAVPCKFAGPDGLFEITLPLLQLRKLVEVFAVPIDNINNAHKEFRRREDLRNSVTPASHERRCLPGSTP